MAKRTENEESIDNNNRQELLVREHRDNAWLKSILNNIVLLKWVRKYSADNFLKDTAMAKKLCITTSEESIGILDTGAVKAIFTDARFEGKELARYTAKEVRSILEVLDSKVDATFIVSAEGNHELIVQQGNSIIVLCPVIKSD